MREQFLPCTFHFRATGATKQHRVSDSRGKDQNAKDVLGNGRCAAMEMRRHRKEMEDESVKCNSNNADKHSTMDHEDREVTAESTLLDSEYVRGLD
jgi:hypothetical protein